MSHDLDQWAKRFFAFDMYTNYSDDHREWKAGIKAGEKLKEDVTAANFTVEEKLEILRKVGELSDASYIRTRELYPDFSERPLWNEGSGPDRKDFVISYLEMKKWEN